MIKLKGARKTLN